MSSLLDLIATIEGMREYFDGCIAINIGSIVTITLGDGKSKPKKHYFTYSQLINLDCGLLQLIDELWKGDGFEYGEQ